MDVNWWAFGSVLLLAYVIPGPDFAIILRSATRGWRPGIAAATGAQVGLCAHMLAAVLGLSLLLARSAEALTVVRYAGAAYLCFLGVRLLLTRRIPATDEAQVPDETAARTAFVQGLGTNLLNPKAILFFASVLPQFVDNRGSMQAQILVLGTIDVLAGVVVWAVLVVVGVRLAAILSRPAVRQWWDRVTGGALTGIGAAMAVSKA